MFSFLVLLQACGLGRTRAGSPARRSHRGRICLEILEDRVTPTSVTVKTLSSLPVPGRTDLVTLDQAIATVNRSSDTSNQINFQAGLSGTTILPRSESILNNVAITGNGSDSITISGGNAFNLFTVFTAYNVSITGVTMSNGATSSDGGAIDNSGTLTLTNDVLLNNSAQDGGAIWNYSSGTLILSGTTVEGNQANNKGGGIGSSGVVSINNSLITTNGAVMGGGLYNGTTGTLTLTMSSVSNNNSYGNGAGIYNLGTLNMTGGAIYFNQTINGYGGGLFNGSGSAGLTTVAIQDNSASHGGGFYANGGYVSLSTDCTLSGNHASYGTGNGGEVGLVGEYNWPNSATITDDVIVTV
jgi:hypothetical protein